MQKLVQGADPSFTGQHKDIVAGQCNWSREYGPAPGRWWVPDRAAANPMNPESWNEYAYVGGTPMEATDPLGLSGTNVCAVMYGEVSSCTVTPDPESPACGFWARVVGTCGSPVTKEDCVIMGTWGGPGCPSFPSPSLYGGAGLDQDPGGGSGGGANGGPPIITKRPGSTLVCASRVASSVSLAAALHHVPGLGSGVGGFVADAVGGNILSGVTDLGESIATGEGGGHSAFYNLGQADVAGPTLGLRAMLPATARAALENSPWGKGLADATLGALPVVGEYASGFGEIKAAVDVTTYASAALGCVLGIFH